MAHGLAVLLETVATAAGRFFGFFLGLDLDFVGALERADTTDVAPMAHPLAGLTQRLRPDVVTEQDHHEQYQANAPQVAAGLYLVPKVIE